MDQNEKIIQISAAGDEAVYALSSEGKIYMGIHHGSGFEWRILPPMNRAKMESVISKGGGEEESSQPVFSGAVGELKTATIIRDEFPMEKKPEPETKKE